ncbi:MAG: FAD-dependent oxidoreductase [Desulfobacterales bacterium]
MPEQTVLIVGGGIAGLSAANQLAAMKISSILVERQSTVGGHAARYACKATFLQTRP